MRKRIAAVAGVLLLAGVIVSIAATGGSAGTTQTYLVVYKSTSVASDAAASIQKAGGTLVYSSPEIGVTVATSSSGSFRDALLKDNKVDDVSSTAGFAYQLPSQTD